MQRKSANVAFCYNCGVELTEENKTAEHIPARNLFNGVEESKRQNLLTVPGCKECNEKFAAFDAEIRDIIAISNDDVNALQDFSAKAMRGMSKTKDFENRVSVASDGKSATVEFSKNRIEDLHLKNFKGLFVEEFEIVLPEYFQTAVVMDGDEQINTKAAQVFYDLLKAGNPEWKFSGHTDIFKYLISAYGIVGEGVGKIDNLDNAMGVVAVMIYHGKVFGMVNAVKKNIINEVKAKYPAPPQSPVDFIPKIIDYNM